MCIRQQPCLPFLLIREESCTGRISACLPCCCEQLSLKLAQGRKESRRSLNIFLNFLLLLYFIFMFFFLHRPFGPPGEGKEGFSPSVHQRKLAKRSGASTTHSSKRDACKELTWFVCTSHTGPAPASPRSACLPRRGSCRAPRISQHPPPLPSAGKEPGRLLKAHPPRSRAGLADSLASRKAGKFCNGIRGNSPKRRAIPGAAGAAELLMGRRCPGVFRKRRQIQESFFFFFFFFFPSPKEEAEKRRNGKTFPLPDGERFQP